MSEPETHPEAIHLLSDTSVSTPAERTATPETLHHNSFPCPKAVQERGKGSFLSLAAGLPHLSFFELH